MTRTFLLVSWSLVWSIAQDEEEMSLIKAISSNIQGNQKVDEVLFKTKVDDNPTLLCNLELVDSN